MNMAAFAASQPAELPVQPTFQSYVSFRPEDEGSTFIRGYTVAHLIGALRCKSEGRGFDSRWRDCVAGIFY